MTDEYVSYLSIDSGGHTDIHCRCPPWGEGVYILYLGAEWDRPWMEVVEIAISLFGLSPALILEPLFLFFGDAHFSEGNVFDKTLTRCWVLSRSLFMAILTTSIQGPSTVLLCLGEA